MNWVPIIGLAFAITMQFFGGIWWISKLESRVENNNTIAVENAKAIQTLPDLKDSILLIGKDVSFMRENMTNLNNATRDRFTRQDWVRESAKGYSDVKHNQDSLKELYKEIRTLDDRVDALEARNTAKQ